MKNKILFVILFCLSLPALSADKYPNFESLVHDESVKENTDYKITVLDRSSPVSILAIHGGGIERGTSELTRAIGGDFNEYYFEGTRKEDNFSLHITATHFNEPKAMELVSKSKYCLSLHGYRGSGRKTFCVGGGNKLLASNIISKLMSLGPDVDIISPCTSFPGKESKNIVNRCEYQGVQLEMNDDLTKELMENPKFLNDVATALRSAMQSLIE